MVIDILIIMKHSYGQMGFPEIFAVEHGTLRYLEERKEFYNLPKWSNNGYKAVLSDLYMEI